MYIFRAHAQLTNHIFDDAILCSTGFIICSVSRVEPNINMIFKEKKSNENVIQWPFGYDPFNVRAYLHQTKE